jgi:two-component system, LuxR family, sensor kinase FixL
MDAALCFAVAGIYLLVWFKQRRRWEYLLFSCSAAATGFIALFELAMLRSETTAQYGSLLQWAHLPIWVVVVALVWFGHLYLRAGRRWLVWTICGERTLVLILNFLFPPNINFREITSLRHVSWWGGETVVVPVAVPNPWSLLSQLTLLLLLIFFVDATITAARRGDRGPPLVLGGSVIFFLTLSFGQLVLVNWGVIHLPIFGSFTYLFIIAAGGYALGEDLLRAAHLAKQFQVSEAALRESEARIKLAANAANLGLWVWDIGNDEFLVTEKWRRLFGFAESEPVNFGRWLQLVHPEDRERMNQTVQDMLEHGGGERESEYRITRLDGSTRWISGYGGVELDERGKPAFTRGVSRDITKRKIAEEELRESEARFRVVADAAPVLIWMSGPDKLCTFFNKGWLDFTGRTMEQELGNGWAEGVHSDDLKHCLEIYGSSFDARQPFTMEYRLRRNDGEYRWVLDNGIPRFASDGAFLGYIGSCVGITERKLAEEKFRLVIDAAPNALVMVDSAGVISFANAPAATVFGYSLSELIGRPIETLIPERFRDRHAGYRNGFLSEPSSRAMGAGRDLFGRRKDGSEFPVEVGLSPIHTAEGLFVMASVIDITARKQAELEHQRQNMELARVGRVAVMGELAASLAHEVNNPIGAIVANASAAQRLIAAGKIGTAELTELLADIVADGRRAGEVIQGIRNMVRKGEARRCLTPIGDTIRQLLRIVHADAIGRDVKVTAEVGPDACQVWGDPVQLLQVLLNLALNALEAMSAMPPDARRVVIRAGRDGNGDILVSVRDSGPGFPSGMAEDLFEPFFSTKSEGTGMGLAISRSIIEAHGGTLSGENCDGGGACFTVRLPQPKQDKSQAA